MFSMLRVKHFFEFLVVDCTVHFKVVHFYHIKNILFFYFLAHSFERKVQIVNANLATVVGVEHRKNCS